MPHSDCKYLGNDLWDCGHMDNAEECDCHACLSNAAQRLRNAAEHLIVAAGLTDANFPLEDGDADAEAVILLEDVATTILGEDHEPSPDKP